MRKVISPAYKYIESQLSPESDLKLKARQFSQQLGLDQISISPTEAHLIQFIASMIEPKKIVEIGTLTGLSCLYFLETLKGVGKVWTLEKSNEHATLAGQSLQSYIDQGQCEIVLGDARESLVKLESAGPFDIVFIDGNKAAYYDYWKWSEANVRSGGLIFIDNVFLAGAVWGDLTQQKFNDKQINQVQKMITEIIGSPDFRSTFIPTQEGLLVVQKN